MSASKVDMVALGELIEPLERRNTDRMYDTSYVRGISNSKEIMPTKAEVDETVIHKFYVINRGEFIYNPRTTRMGEKVGLAYNNTDTPLLFSFNNLAFKIKETAKDRVLPEYLFLNFARSHFDRFTRINSWGSATELFLFEDLFSFEIPLPDIGVQRELVGVYEGLKELAEENEAMLAPLAGACEAFIINCKKNYPAQPLGEYIEIDEQVNTEGKTLPFYGININKEFMPTNASTEGLNPNKYLVIEKGKFVFSGMQTGRDICIRIGLYADEQPALLSPAYTTFRVKDETVLLPEFLMLQFKRSEMDRLGWFKSDSSVRSNLDWERFTEIQIPLPPIGVQERVVALYKCYEECKRIAAEAREELKRVCPALIQRGKQA